MGFLNKIAKSYQTRPTSRYLTWVKANELLLLFFYYYLSYKNIVVQKHTMKITIQ